MSFSFYWCLCAVTDQEFEELKQKFEYAKEKQKVPEEYKGAYDLCKKSPLSILPKFIPYHDLPEDKKIKEIFKNGYIEARLHNEFSCSCNIAEYRDIFQCLPLNEDDVLRFIINESPPISVLYFALGLEASEMLPGFLGNMLIHREEIDFYLNRIAVVFGKLNEEAWDRARRFISVCTAGSPSLAYDSEIENIFSALPVCLGEAKRRNKHFAAVATHQF